MSRQGANSCAIAPLIGFCGSTRQSKQCALELRLEQRKESGAQTALVEYILSSIGLLSVCRLHPAQTPSHLCSRLRRSLHRPSSLFALPPPDQTPSVRVKFYLNHDKRANKEEFGPDCCSKLAYCVAQEKKRMSRQAANSCMYNSPTPDLVLRFDASVEAVCPGTKAGLA